MLSLRFSPPPVVRVTSPSRRGICLRRRLSPPSRGWRDDSPLDDGSGADKRSKKKSKKIKKLAVGVSGKGSADGATLQEVDLGKGQSVALYTPANVADVEGDRISYETLESFREELYGAGDVIWPASMALARLIAHCPSLVRGKRVLEVGAGLGLVGNAAAKAGAAEVLMVDYDHDVVRTETAGSHAVPPSLIKSSSTCVPTNTQNL